MAAVNQAEPADATPASFSFAQWARGWRYFFWFLAVLLVTVLFYTEENWRGPWAWARRQRQMKMRGEQTTAKDFIPPHVPGKQNFAMTPVLDSAFRARSLRGFTALSAALALAEEFDPASKGIRSNQVARANTWVRSPPGLDVWRAVLMKATNQTVLPQDRLQATNFTVSEAAEASLAALVGCEPFLEEIQSASLRPHSRFDIAYEQPDPASILLPHLAELRQLSQLLLLRASSELELDRTDAAFADVELMLRLADAMRTEPILISQLVRARQLQMAIEPLSFGMRKWSEPQLRALQEHLERFDFCTDGARVLRSERSFFGDSMIEFVRRSENRPQLLSGFGGFAGSTTPGGFEFAGVLMSIAPEGWFDLEHLSFSHMFEDYVLPTIDATNRLIRPGAARRAEARLAALVSHSAVGLLLRHQFFCGLMLPSISKVAQKLAIAQTAADTTALACALERYRRRNGQFPDSLSQLVPEFIAQLPHDVINSQPLKYRRTDDGQYLLYSVGWNETDDGGKAVQSKSEEVDRLPGDWVWHP